MTDQATIVCMDCGSDRAARAKTNGEPKLPSGWKRHQSRIYCPSCWRSAYVLRPLSVTAIEPVDGGTKDEWWDALRQVWRDSAELATWASQQLFAHDVVMRPGETKMPKMAPIYLYGLAGEQGMIRTGEASSRQCILRWVESTYRARRKEVVYQRSARPPAYTFPCPWRVHNRDWSASRDEDGGHLQITLPLGGRRWTVRVWPGTRGRHRGSVTSQFDTLISGAVQQGELMICADQAHGREAGTSTSRNNGGRNRRIIAARFKLMAWWPRTEKRALTGDPLVCHTDADSLLVYRVGDQIQHLHYAHVRRWVQVYERRRHAFSEDLKSEWRSPARVRRRLVDSQESQRRKHHHRIQSACQQAAAAVVGFASRRRCRYIQYDDTNRAWVELFPWHQLQESLIHCADKHGMALVTASGDVLTDPLGVLAST